MEPPEDVIAPAPQRRRPPGSFRWSTLLLFVCWLVPIFGGVAALERYSVQPASAGNPPALWPATEPPGPNAGRPALIMFAHPRCPCTSASMEELARIMARASGMVDARVIFFCPPNPTADWTDSDLVRSAKAIPGLSVEFDPGGAKARQFGAPTSGLTLLYDRSGKLRFSGGITAARGHAGDNDGEDAVLDLIINHDPSPRRRHPVFGCALTECRDARVAQGASR